MRCFLPDPNSLLQIPSDSKLNVETRKCTGSEFFTHLAATLHCLLKLLDAVLTSVLTLCLVLHGCCHFKLSLQSN